MAQCLAPRTGVPCGPIGFCLPCLTAREKRDRELLEETAHLMQTCRQCRDMMPPIDLSSWPAGVIVTHNREHAR